MKRIMATVIMTNNNDNDAIKICNHTANTKSRQNRIKSIQIKPNHVCLKAGNFQKAMFYWNARNKT